MDPVIRIAETADDLLKVMVVRGIVFVEEQQVDWEGEFDELRGGLGPRAGRGGRPAGRRRPPAPAAGRLGQVRTHRRAPALARPGPGPRPWSSSCWRRPARRGVRRFRLHAQTYLEDFYAGYGFVREGDVFDECGIPHILMTREDD